MKKRPLPSENLARNLQMLLRETGISRPELAKKSKVSLRMINYILKRERIASVEVADALARPFGLDGWEIIMPDLKSDLARSGKLSELIKHYSNSSQEGRDYINRVAEQEAKYGTEK